MRAPRPILERLPPTSPVSPLLWYGVLGAPGAWTLQMGLGYWLAEAECSPTGGQWGISLATWGVATGAFALAVGAGALATAVAIFRRWDDREEPPPDGRVAFLAIVGMTVSTLFLILIAFSAAGILTFSACNQS